MKKLLALLGILLAATMLTGCNLKNGGAKDTIIKVNGENITKKQFDSAFEKIAQNSALSQLGIDFRKDTESFFYVAAKQRVVNELIYKTLVDQEISKRNLKASKEDMEKAYAEMVEEVGGKEKFNEILKQHQISQSTFKKDLEDKIKIDKLIDTLGVVNVSDKDVEKYYKSHIKEFSFPERVKSSYIAISVDPTQIKDVLLGKEENKKLSKDDLEKKIKEEIKAKETKAKEVLAKAKQNPSQFAQLAKENSDDIFTSGNGGDTGFLSKEEMHPDIAKVAFAQKPNTVSELIVTPNAYYIVMVTDRQKAGIEPFDKVKFQLKNYLEMQEKMTLFQKLMEEVKTNAKIEYLNEDYNPEEIEKKLKEIQKKNPSLMDTPTAKE